MRNLGIFVAINSPAIDDATIFINLILSEGAKIRVAYHTKRNPPK
jgi:hypothetical protein